MRIDDFGNGLRLAAVAVLLAGAAACADAPTAPRVQAPGGDGARLATLSATALQVSVSGPTKMLKEGTATYTASVGSNDPANYHFQWISHVCLASGYCYSPNVLAQGVGLSQVNVLVPEDWYKVRISVQVHENTEYHLSGLGQISLLGPSTSSQTLPAFKCNAPSYFPHKDWDVYHSGSGQTTYILVGSYARDCSGNTVYQ